MAHRSKRQKLKETGESATKNPHVSFDLNIDADGKPSRTLFVRSLAPSTTNEHLVNHFSQSALLKHAIAVLDKSSKVCKGYGFVTFVDLEDAWKARDTLDDTELNGKRISVEFAEPRHRDLDGGNEAPNTKLRHQSKRSQSNTHSQAVIDVPGGNSLSLSRLIVRNLPWSVKDPEQLARLFMCFGKVKDVQLPRQPSGALRGFGFILIRGRKNAEKAIADLNGRILDGRALAVDWAAPKNAWNKQQQASNQLRIIGTEHFQPSVVDCNRSDQGTTKSTSTDGFDDNGDDDDDDDDDDATSSDLSGFETISQQDANKGTSDDQSHRTLFVRNLPYTVNDDALYQHFRAFGPLQYARVVMDYTSDPEGRSRGTGFVCFHRIEDATKCLQECPGKLEPAAQTPAQTQRGQATMHQSLLQNSQSDPQGLYTIDGRLLLVDPSLNKSKAQELEAQSKAKRNKQDKRHLFLLREGNIPTNSPLFNSMSQTEIKMREASARERQRQLQKNPSLYVSLTRLAIRNIPRFVTTKDLKVLANKAVAGFAEDVESSQRQPLSEEELSRCLEASKEADSSKGKRRGVVSQAKIVFENRDGSKVSEGNGSGRSRGYGFIEYTSHHYALMGLRWLNGHLIKLSDKLIADGTIGQSDTSKRLIAEFAIENAQVVRRRQERQDKSRGKVNDKNNKDLIPPDQKFRPGRYSEQGSRSVSKGKPLDQADKMKAEAAITHQIIGRKRARRKSKRG